jgi:hypothetical protein
MPGDPAQTAVASPGMLPPDAPPMAGPPMGPPTGPPSGGFPPGAPLSPYAGMPPGPPGPGQQNKTPLYVAIGVVATIALVALIVMLTGGDDDDPAGPDNPPITDPRTPTTATVETVDDPSGPDDPPSGDATVEVVETGFSNFTGGLDERSGAYGFVVENTGDGLATDIQISVSAYDAGGTALASASHTVYVLRPGEQMGIGDEFFGTTLSGEIDSIDVQVSEPSEYGADDVPTEGALTAEGITTRADEYSLSTTFTAKSTYGQQIDYPSAYAIYRDADGNIVGGSRGSLDFLPANGSAAGEVTSWDVIPNVATTEIYLDPGYFD